MIVVSCMVQITKETLIQSQSQIYMHFYYIAASLHSFNSSIFAPPDCLLCIKIQE